MMPVVNSLRKDQNGTWRFLTKKGKNKAPNLICVTLVVKDLKMAYRDINGVLNMALLHPPLR